MDKDAMLQSMRDAHATFEAGHSPWMDGRVSADTIAGGSFGHYLEHLPHLA